MLGLIQRFDPVEPFMALRQCETESMNLFFVIISCLSSAAVTQALAHDSGSVVTDEPVFNRLTIQNGSFMRQTGGVPRG